MTPLCRFSHSAHVVTMLQSGRPKNNDLLPAEQKIPSSAGRGPTQLL